MGLTRRKVALLPAEAHPPDLAPIDQRDGPWPIDEPLDHEQVRAALWHRAGNITKAADLLRTSAARLGSVVRRSPELLEARAQAAEMLVDRAEGVLIDALGDEDSVRADNASRFILERLGKLRGWGTPQNATAGIALSFGGQGGSGQLAVKWETAPTPDVIQDENA